jgi:hypothetical protein
MQRQRQALPQPWPTTSRCRTRSSPSSTGRWSLCISTFRRCGPPFRPQPDNTFETRGHSQVQTVDITASASCLNFLPLAGAAPHRMHNTCNIYAYGAPCRTSQSTRPLSTSLIQTTTLFSGIYVSVKHPGSPAGLISVLTVLLASCSQASQPVDGLCNRLDHSPQYFATYGALTCSKKQRL